MSQTKHLAIPIDFTIESLNTLKMAVEENKQAKLNILLIYGELESNSISSLLFYSPEKIIRSLQTPQFQDAISILKNTFESSIQVIRIKLFHGYNTQSMKFFLEANNIDEIYIPKNYQLVPKKNGFNPIPLLKKSKIQCHEVSWKSNVNLSQQDELNLLFNL